MKTYTQNILALSFVLIFAVLLIVTGCDEKEVYTLSQEEEVERYITDSYLGSVFFAKDFLSGSMTFGLPGEDTIYTETVDSTWRRITIDDLGDTLEVSTGTYYYANVSVLDVAWTTIRRQVGDDVTDWSSSRSLERYGFLVKLGTNDHEYSGWLLQGFASDQVGIVLETVTGETLALDYTAPLVVSGTELSLVDIGSPGRSYMDIDAASSIGEDSRIAFDGCGQCYYLVHYQTDSGAEALTVPNPEATGDCVPDTLQIGTSDNASWSYLMVRSVCRVNDSTTTSSTSYLPFRITR